MKAETNKLAPKFSPVEMHITFETQEELDRFTTLFNYVKVGEYITGLNSDAVIYQAAARAGGNTLEGAISVANALAWSRH